MSAKPWFPFFPSDWRADSALRLCSPGARLLWLEMLCLMHEAEPRGHMLVNGKRTTVAQTARLAGISEPECAEWTLELEEAGVFSRTDEDVIFSRKMVRDSKKSQEQSDRVSKRWSGNNDRNTPGNTETHTGSIPHIPNPEPEPKERGKPLSAREEDFALFWAAYPKKVGKPQAASAFAKAMKRSNIRAVLAGLERAKASRAWSKDGGQYIPHPTTWLNRDGWADEGPEEAPTPPGTRRLDNGHLFNPEAPW